VEFYGVCLLCLHYLPVINRPYKDADVVSVNILGTDWSVYNDRNLFHVRLPVPLLCEKIFIV